MTELARITKHPTDRDVVLVHMPYELRNEMGRFLPARYSSEHKAYIMHGEHIAAFYRFARTISLHVTDERRVTAGYRTMPVECESCGQGGSLRRPPKMCPACGQPWTPSNPPVKEEALGRHECPSCRHRQRGRFPFCAECGGRMDYTRDTGDARVVPLDQSRPRLRDPIPLGAQLERMGPIIPNPRPPLVPKIHKGRPVETIDLLGEGESDETRPE